jgi:hypothetical protein
MTIPTEPIGSIPRPLKLLEAVNRHGGSHPDLEPKENLPGYSREEFINDLLSEHEKEIRGCFAKGAQKVQIDFTEGRLAVKIDPSGMLLNSFIELNNLALSRFSDEERSQIGVHTCPGSDRDSTHSAEADYAELLPSLFELRAGSFYIALAGEPDRTRVLGPRTTADFHHSLMTLRLRGKSRLQRFGLVLRERRWRKK